MSYKTLYWPAVDLKWESDFWVKKRPLHRSFRKPQNNTILFYSSKNISTSLRSPRCDVSFVCILPRSLGQLECLHLKTGPKKSHFHSLPFWQAEATVPFTSPKVISASPTNFCLSRIDSQIFCNLNPSKKPHLPIGQVKNRIVIILLSTPLRAFQG